MNGYAFERGGWTTDGARVPVRPQTLVLMFGAQYMSDPDVAVSTGSVLSALESVDVGERAARSTVSRMLRRGSLEKLRRGRRTYLHLPERTREVLAAGERRAWRSPVDTHWDGHWTLLGFSFPESRRADRHQLRSRLAWAGFGLLQNGLWIAPGAPDISEIVSELGTEGNLKVFRAEALAPTDIVAMIADAWDLDALRRGYEGFLARWDVPSPLPEAPHDLARELWLLGEWLTLVRRDPGLPAQYLPADWPAVRAEDVAERLRQRYRDEAERVADRLLDTIRLGAIDLPQEGRN